MTIGHYFFTFFLQISAQIKVRMTRFELPF